MRAAANFTRRAVRSVLRYCVLTQNGRQDPYRSRYPYTSRAVHGSGQKPLGSGQGDLARDFENPLIRPDPTQSEGNFKIS